MKLTPAIRLSLGLVFLTLSILVVAQGLGLLPNPEQQHLKAREQVAENLALQTTLAVKRNDQSLIKSLFDNTVEQNANISSIGLVKNTGATVYETPTHANDWKLSPGMRSNAEYMRIPINIGGDKKGSIEVSFIPLGHEGHHFLGVPHFVLFIAFVCISGFVAFWFYIKRVLQQLDPSSVVPARVRNALNIMAEGVMILDKREQIVLANDSITRMLNLAESKLVGRKASDLAWADDKFDSQFTPWHLAQTKGEQQVNVRMKLKMDDDKVLVFRVNAIPIKDGRGGSQGIIASFDNITELEEKNNLLKQMVKNLAEKQQAIEVKNKELHHLASRDPLTNCYNRRTLFDFLDEHYAKQDNAQSELCVIMADIDHFKNINDTYGHNFGDETIQTIAQTLKAHCRENDMVARFGGEEFCIVLPNTPIERACEIADTCRKTIEAKRIKNVAITSSFGIASVKFGAKSPTDLIHLADQALYKSKEDGRNRCTMWSPFLNRTKQNQAN